MYSMAANFKKKRPCASSSRNPSVPAGSKVSIGNNQLLVSSGVPSLDNILGEFAEFLVSRYSSSLKSREFVSLLYCLQPTFVRPNQKLIVQA